MDWNYKPTVIRERPDGPFRALHERRVDPGTAQKPVIDRPSLLAPAPPKTPVYVRPKGKR